MYGLMKDVINRGNFDFSNILNKINSQWVEDKLTDDERAELIQSAQNKANFKNSVDLYAKVLELDKKILEQDKKIQKLEAQIELAKANNTVDTGKVEDAENNVVEDEIDENTEGTNATEEGVESESNTTETEKVETVTYPEFEVGKWYYNGDIVSFEGQNYKCIAPLGVVCVWTPRDYSPFWELLEIKVVEEITDVEGEPEDDEPTETTE